MSSPGERTFKPKLLLYKFYDYAKSAKLELLEDDKKWLGQLCCSMQQDKLRILLNKYMIIWQNEMAKEPIEHKKQNIGRYHANTWIRIEIQGK